MAEQAYYAECRTAGEAPGTGLQIAVILHDVPERTIFPATLPWPCPLGDDCPHDKHQGRHELRRVSAEQLAELMPDDDYDEHDDGCPDAMRWWPEAQP